MILEIIKIREPKESQSDGIYRMIEFKDVKTGKWYQTFINPAYRNAHRWNRVAVIGNLISIPSLKMKSEDIIDADSVPVIVDRKPLSEKEQYLLSQGII